MSKKDVRAAVVVAYDEQDVARGARVEPNRPSDVDARHGVGWNVPGRGDRPVAAVDQASRCLGQASRLVLRKHDGRNHRRDVPSAIAPVITEPVDVDSVVGRGSLDLEVDRLARSTLMSVAKPMIGDPLSAERSTLSIGPARLSRVLTGDLHSAHRTLADSPPGSQGAVANRYTLKECKPAKCRAGAGTTRNSPARWLGEMRSNAQ